MYTVLKGMCLGAKLRVSGNRCVLFNSLTYMYIHIYIYIYLKVKLINKTTFSVSEIHANEIIRKILMKSIPHLV